MDKKIITLGAVLSMLTVMIGAFGAHGLKAILLEYDTLEVFETAVQYQGMHAMALIFVGLIGERLHRKWMNFSKWSFLLGIIFFSGSLYILSLSGMRVLGAITPVGGVLFILGWITLVMGLNKKKDSKN